MPTLDIISTERNVIGNIVGTYNELAELMVLAEAGRVTLHTKTYPLAAAADALADLDAGKVRGRAILVPYRPEPRPRHMAKELRFGADARERCSRAWTSWRRRSKSTLGPKGRNVIIEKITGSPVVTNDGVTIAREIHLSDQFENMGAQLVKEAAIKTNDIVGDGTTTATVLAHAIVREGMQAIAAGGNPVLVKRGIDLAVGRLAEHLPRSPTRWWTSPTTRGWRRSRPTTTTRSAR